MKSKKTQRVNFAFYPCNNLGQNFDKKSYPVAAKNARGIIISHPFMVILPIAKRDKLHQFTNWQMIIQYITEVWLYYNKKIFKKKKKKN